MIRSAKTVSILQRTTYLSKDFRISMNRYSRLTTACLFVLVLFDDSNQLTGRWKLVRDHIAGSERTGIGKAISEEWIVMGKTLTQNRSTNVNGTIKFDKSKLPWRFEKSLGKEFPGIVKAGACELEGRRLKLYSAISKKFAPPENIPATPKPGYLLEIWERVSELKGEEFDGEWKVRDLFTSERHMPLSDVTVVVNDSSYTETSKSSQQYTLSIDQSQLPMRLDLITNDGKISFPRFFRISNNDRLTVWINLGTKPRDLSDEADSKNTFQVFERVKPR